MPALTTEQVLQEEAKAIHGKDLSGKTGTELYQELNKLNSAALCLSGGGIRSAAFALGVIQALAVHPRPGRDKIVAEAKESLLAKFRYLSTVSGGGYIGGWLSAWIKRVHFPAVWAGLTSRSGGPDLESPVIGWLRAYSNFLTPKLGIMSADSWSALALWLRNLILNWLVIVPVLCLVLLALKFFAILFVWFSQVDSRSCDAWFYSALGLGCLCMIYALRFTTCNRPTRGDSRADQIRFLRNDLLPATVASISIMFAFASPCALVWVYSALGKGIHNLWRFYLPVIVIGVVIYAIAWVAAYVQLRNRQRPLRTSKDYGKDLFCWIIAGGVFGALMAVGAYIYYLYLLPYRGIWFFKPAEVLLIVFGVPWMLIAQLVAEMIFVGLTSVEKNSDADREWLGRSAGWFLVVALGWAVTMFLVFVGSELVEQFLNNYKGWLTSGSAGVGAGGLTAWLGKSRLSPAQGVAKDWKGISANVVLAIGAAVFAVMMIVLGSALLDELLYDGSLISTSAFKETVNSPDNPNIMQGAGSLLLVTAISFVIAFLIGAIASRNININRFSLHALYRNRLIRAFLGASNFDHRNANPFTNFDISDNLRVAELWSQDAMPGVPRQPFHVINMALNLASTSNLAWQERKAASFTASPLHTGTAVGNFKNNPADIPVAQGAFRRSFEYGDPNGISLGTAVAISGAAASPNMGYHSSPALALLLTLFNVRLGWWLGNPIKDDEKICKSEGPLQAIVPLLCEMFGMTNDKSNYIYLSDGGHFENLALYEMVRRRCRYIVLSDAGQDKDFRFEDLGNAVRKISIDLGVPITFHGLEMLQKRTEDASAVLDAPYHAIGVIDYPFADHGSEKGYILYIKPGYHGVESADIQAYAIANKEFPHQSTGDQFFSESQFESYRKLGFEITDNILWKVVEPLPNKIHVDPKEVFESFVAAARSNPTP